MKQKTKSMVAATALFGIGLGALIETPTAIEAQQKTEARGEYRGGPGGQGREGGRPPGPQGPRLGELLDQLNLSAAQQEQASKMLEFEHEKMEALHQQMLRIQSQTRTNVEAILTAEQKKKLTQLEAQKSSRNDGPPGGGRGHGGGPGGGGPGGGGPGGGGPGGGGPGGGGRGGPRGGGGR